MPDFAPLPTSADLAIKPGETLDTYNQRIAPLQNTLENADMAMKLGSSGAGDPAYKAAFAPTADDQKAAQDAVAKEFGYPDSNSFFADAFQKPSQSTQDLYQSAYSAAGLDKIASQIASKQQDLNHTAGVINDNPWYDEAHRKGELSRLTQLANGDIKNLQDEYKLRLGGVHDLVTRNSADMAANDKRQAAMLAYLEKTAKEKATATASDRAASYLPYYASGKQSTQKPQTISVGSKSTVYQWNPTTKSFAPIARGMGGTTTSSTASQKQAIADMNKQLSGVIGTDGHVSPTDYQTARKAWMQKGFSPTAFDTQMKGFRNPNDNYGL